MILQNQIFGHGEIFNRAVVHPFFRDVAQSGLDHFGRRQIGNILVLEHKLAGSDVSQTGNRFGQGTLAVARHTGHAHNFAAVNFEADIFKYSTAPAVDHTHVIQL